MDIFGNSTNLNDDKKIRKVKREIEPEFALSEVVEIASLDAEKTRTKLTTLKVLTIAVFLIIAGKLFVSQIVQGRSLLGLAEGNRIRPRVIAAMRGVITDSKGNSLAKNAPTFDLAVYPSDLPKDKSQLAATYDKLAEISGVDRDLIKKTAEQSGLNSLDEVVIKQNLSREEALIDEQKIAGLQGAFIAQRASRNYTDLPGLSHLLGYTGKVSKDDLSAHPDYLASDWTGKAGVEKTYDDYLKGTNGVEQIEVDSTGRVNRVLVDNNNKEPVAGDNVQLSLDSDLQQKSYEFLMQGIAQAKQNTGDQSINSGVVIAMNPSTGAILSYVSVPYYDNNLFANGISDADYQKLLSDPAKPLLDRGTNGVYPPGSIVKIVMASAGLSEGVITPNTSFSTPAAITIGQYVFPDWKDHSYESTNVERAIAESNDVFFYAVGGGFGPIKGIGIDNMKKWWENFGLGEKTGIDLPTESSGLLPDEAWKKKVRGEDWYIGDTYHASIGQGDLLVTPLQMLRATAAIANGGKLLHPKLVQKIIDPTGNVVKEFGPSVENPQIASPSVIKTVQDGMRLAVTEGSARQLQDLPVTSAGKTGTAQFLDNQKTHAWFEAYAPFDNPQIAIIVLIDGGGGGNEVSEPVANNILQYYFTR